MNTNENTIICANCGCVIENDEDNIVETNDGKLVCRDCAEALGYIQCDDCGAWILESEAIEYDGVFLCEDCRDSRGLVQCEDCGKWCAEEDLVEIYNGWRHSNTSVCQDCADAAVNRGEVFYCDECETYYNADRVGYFETVDGDTICENCYCNHDYCTCAECGDVIHTWDAHWDDNCEEYFCDSCYESHRDSNRIHNYSYKPAPVFHGLSLSNPWASPKFGDPITIGFELEVDNGDDRCGCAEEITDNFDEDTLYLKEDSSVDFEIVTHPRTLKSYLNDLDLEKLCSIPGQYGYSSHNAGSCGLHCHVGRAQLGETSADRQLVISRIALLMYRHWDSLVKFSRRSNGQLSHWACAPDFHFEFGRKYNDSELNDFVRRYYSGRGRYQALNTEPSGTIEFRLWRGSLVPETVKATLQLTSNIVEFCMNKTFEQIVTSKWADVTGYTRYTELDNYLASRNLTEGMETQTIPYGSVTVDCESITGFKLGDYVEIVNADEELVSPHVVGARGRISNFDSYYDDARILILFDTEDTITVNIARAYGHYAGGLAPQNNGYWVYKTNIRLYPQAG